MKNRRNTYLLLALVITVWGIILYKAVTTLAPDKKTAETGSIQTNFTPKPLKTRDTFTISVHPRDPFLDEITPQSKSIPPKRARTKTTKKEAAPPIPIQFSGRIAGSSAKEHIYFVSINNTRHLMKLNDEIGQVTLLRGNAKTIRVKYRNQLKTIPLSQ